MCGIFVLIFRCVMLILFLFEINHRYPKKSGPKTKAVKKSTQVLKSMYLMLCYCFKHGQYFCFKNTVNGMNRSASKPCKVDPEGKLKVIVLKF